MTPGNMNHLQQLSALFSRISKVYVESKKKKASLSTNNYYCYLQKKPLIFEPSSEANEVFYDAANQQLFCMRAGGTLGVTVKGPDENTTHNFRLNQHGDVLSIKFSTDKKILAIQRTTSCVEFVNFQDGMDIGTYSQPCKHKNTSVIGFVWTSPTEIIYVTNNTIELYQVLPERKSVRLQKSITHNVTWFIWNPQCSLLLTASGDQCSSLSLFQIKNGGQIFKIPKFEVDVPVLAPRASRAPWRLEEKDCALVTIYGEVYVSVVKCNVKHGGTTKSEISLYKVSKDFPAKKVHVLTIEAGGKVAMNIVDNAILVHHSQSKCSLLYDIRMGAKSDGFVTYHEPVVLPLPLMPVAIDAHLLPSMGHSDSSTINVTLYHPKWVLFQPNIIIDTKLGCMWRIHLNNEPLCNMVSDKFRLINFLLNRSNSTALILETSRKLMAPGNMNHLQQLSALFSRISKVYVESKKKKSHNASDLGAEEYRAAVIDQSDMYTGVFSCIPENVPFRFLVAALTEYVRILNEHQIPVQHFIYSIIINALVHNKCFYQLHQFIQYRVLTDSKHIACLLLSMEPIYAPAYQLALDMFKRLKTADEQIIEVLLSKHLLLQALRFVRSIGQEEKVSAQKFLEAAKSTDDQQVFYSVFKFFETRNARVRNDPKFVEDDHCDAYVRHFADLFGESAIGVSAA